MVAKITTPKRIHDALNYNEQKVQQGRASCLYAANYLSEAKNINFYQKLYGFETLNSLNERATTKTLHVSLNFDPREKLSDERFIEIASSYMQKIGFGDQPFLVYKHEDAGHPHIHVVSTTIKSDGARINTHNIGRNQSEKARKEIEFQFGLVKAERQQQLTGPGIKPVDVQKVVYGKQETKKSISNIVSAVYSQYKFTSLPEFNAALKQFNVIADRGKEEGRIYANRGLVYRVMDPEGNKIGVPIKASSIGCKPTLPKLEKKFPLNESSRELLKQGTKNIIDECLKSAPDSLKSLSTALEAKQIQTILRQNSEGRIYGITFVDNLNKCVFNGSDLGKSYSIGSLQSSLSVSKEQQIQNDLSGKNKYHLKPTTALQKNTIENQNKNLLIRPSVNPNKLLNQLLSSKSSHENVPFQLMKKKTRKKKRNLSL